MHNLSLLFKDICNAILFVFSDMPLFTHSLSTESGNPIIVLLFYFNPMKVISLLEFPVSLNMRT